MAMQRVDGFENMKRRGEVKRCAGNRVYYDRFEMHNGEIMNEWLSRI